VGIEGMIQKLGLSDELAARTRRFPDAEAVMNYLMTAGDGEVGFGAPTAIGLYTGKHLRYAGPVPAELQSYTNYQAAPTPSATPLAKAFLEYLSGTEARGLMKSAGIE
jgi:molybdate transport system substrate-binding protein